MSRTLSIIKLVPCPQKMGGAIGLDRCINCQYFVDIDIDKDDWIVCSYESGERHPGYVRCIECKHYLDLLYGYCRRARIDVRSIATPRKCYAFERMGKEE